MIGITCFVAGQNPFPEGVYSNVKMLNTKTLSGIYPFTITRNSDSEIKRNGGNDYFIQCDPVYFSKRQIKRELTAIVRHDSLFINGLKIGIGKEYTLALTQGRFLCLYAALPGSRILQSQLRKAGLYQPAGGWVSHGKSYTNARFYYVYDIEKDQINSLDSNVVEQILSPYPEIFSSYKNEQIKSPEIFIKYIAELNKILMK